MRVAVIYDLLPPGSGIGKYTAELLNRLPGEGVTVETISLPRARFPLGDAANHLFRLPWAVWRQAGSFDLFHAHSAITGLPFLVVRKPSVVTWHDLVAMLYGQGGTPGYVRALAPLWFKLAARACRHIIAVSSQTREELIARLGVPPEKISVISEGVDERFRPLERIEERRSYTIGYLGAFISRKRVDYLLRAYHYLRRQHPGLPVQLTLWGKKGYEYERLLALTRGLEHEVSFPGFAPEERLVEIYNSLDVFVFPSQWEGFGLPILEAQRCGVPVVIREEAHIPQEVSRACVKAKSEPDMADQIVRLLIDPAFRQEVVRRGLEHSRQFTWERMVKKTVQLYREVVQER